MRPKIRVTHPHNGFTSVAMPYVSSFVGRWHSPRVRLVVGLIAALLVVGVALNQVRGYASGDDLRYFLARTGDLLSGRDPYSYVVAHPRTSTGDYNDIYLYSPTFYLLLTPLYALGFAHAWPIWAVINAVALLLGSALLVKSIRPSASLSLGMVLAALIAVTGMARYEFYFGNADVVLLALLSAAFYATRTGRLRLGGVLLGLSGLVYLQSVPFVLFYVWKREYRTAAIGAAVFLGGEVLGFLLSPSGTTQHFLTMVGTFLFQWSSFFVNQSLYAVALRLFTPTPYSLSPIVYLHWLPFVLWITSVVVIMLITARMVERERVSYVNPTRAGLEFGLALAALMLYFPVLESNTFIVAGLILGTVALFALQLTELHAIGDHLWLLGAMAGLFLIYLVNLTTVSASRLGMFRTLQGGRLAVAVFTSVPYLYIALLTYALVYWAMRIEHAGRRG